jgi:hypothetical protein
VTRNDQVILINNRGIFMGNYDVKSPWDSLDFYESIFTKRPQVWKSML